MPKHTYRSFWLRPEQKEQEIEITPAVEDNLNHDFAQRRIMELHAGGISQPAIIVLDAQKDLHPLRRHYLNNRLEEIAYLERQQNQQDSFATSLYGKQDFTKEKEEIFNELNAGKQSRLPNSKTNNERFWDIADQQTARKKYPELPPKEGEALSRLERENPKQYHEYQQQKIEDSKPWEEIDADIQNGTTSPSKLSDKQWASILSQSNKELQEKQQHSNGAPYCNVYARDRLLNDGIYMSPGKSANQIIDGMDKKNSDWGKIPKKNEGGKDTNGHLDHQQAHDLAKDGYTVVATYRNPNNMGHGHISVINPAAGMKNSGKWGKKLPSVDGYNPAKKAIKEGESLSEQFGKDKEPYMNYYVFTGKKHS